MSMELESLRIFVKVAELASFTRAAEQLGMQKARVSLHVRALEAEVSVRLLHRTTRSVRLTPDGETFLARAKRLVTEADELGAMFQTKGALRGKVRVDLPVSLARAVIIPRLPELLAAHPQLEIQLSTTDRRVDVVREGFDCVLRIGALGDSDLVAQRLGALAMMNYVSPAYLRRYGRPRTLADLDGHVLVHYSLGLGADPPTFEFHDGKGYRERPMHCLVTVNNADAYEAACLAGLGIIQAPRYGHAAAIARGDLVEILPEHTAEPMPVHLVHAHGRNVPKRTRAVLTWIAQTLAPHLAGM
ncbi:Transcriptional regulator [Minicystis rosea]|nr:Transcriptional regulator [Minicystis rosea]